MKSKSHPEHDLLFVATQVARAAGLKNPSQSIALHAHLRDGVKLSVTDLRFLHELCRGGHTVKSHSWLLAEACRDDLHLRGHAPASEPFRKWGTEEVLPTIRRTGKYNAEQSSNRALDRVPT